MSDYVFAINVPAWAKNRVQSSLHNIIIVCSC